MFSGVISFLFVGKVYSLLDSKYWKKRVFDEMVYRVSYAILQVTIYSIHYTRADFFGSVDSFAREVQVDEERSYHGGADRVLGV